MIERQILYIRRFYIIVLIFFFIILAGEYWYFGMNLTQDSIIYSIHIVLGSFFGSFVVVSTILISGILRIILIIISIRKLYKLLYQSSVKIGWYLCLFIIINYTLMFLTNPTFIISYLSIMYIISLLGIIRSNFYLIETKITLTNQNLLLIKKEVIDLSTKYTRLEIQDIAERCNVSRGLVDNALLKMINNNEVYGNYTQTSGLIEFDQESNLEEIDNLLKTYAEWEEDNIGKKSNLNM